MARATLRRGSARDISTLVLHRRRMWEDIGGRTKRQLDAADPVYRRWISTCLRSGRCAAFVVEAGGEPVASGVLWLQDAQPRPGWRGTRQGYLLSMYTEPEFRGKGFASRIVRESIRWARSKGIDRVTLHASTQGRGVYLNEGFQRTWEMRFLLRKGAPSRHRKR